jgi:Tol biopolymer transport system component
MEIVRDRRRGPRNSSTKWRVAVLALAVAGCSDAAGPTDSASPTTPPPIDAMTGRVAFSSTRDGSPWIYVADSTGVRRLLPGDAPAWSPDGNTLAYETPGGIRVMSPDGRSDHLIRRSGRQPAWSPDGTRIAFADGGIRVMQADGSSERLIVANDFIQRGDEMQRPAWSRDGRRLAFVRYDCCWEEPAAVYVVALDGTPPELVDLFQNTTYPHWAPAWSPDGRSMAFIDNFELTTIGVDDRDVRFLGIRVAYESSLDWSPDGRRVVYSDYNADRDRWSAPFTGHLRVYVAVPATGRVQQLIPEATGAANPDYWDNHAAWSR